MNDHHIHTYFSGDCGVPMENMVLSGISKGVNSLIFTDHLDIDYADPNYSNLFKFDPKLYFKEFNSLKLRYSENIKLHSGIEIGIQPHLVDSINSLFPIESFDFKLLSMHTCNKKDLHSGEFFKDKTGKEAYINYYEELYFCIKNYDTFDIVGHLNLLDRYSKYLSEKIPFNAYSDVIESIFKELIFSGKGIEVNTSGYRYGMDSFLPNDLFLSLYRDLGGEIIVFGSDSHTEADVCHKYDFTINSLKKLNFKYISYFEDNHFNFIKLK